MTIIHPNTLLHTDFQEDTRLTISAPAVNSSGDVYHIAAYIILCHHFNWPIPHVYIGYDRSTTEIQAQRIENFLKLIGFGPYTHRILTPTDSNYAIPRSSSIRKELFQKTIKHMDQKITTALLRQAFEIYGHKTISSILKKTFIDKVKNDMFAHHHEKCQTWIKKQLHKIKQWRRQSRKTNFIILHHRISHDANDTQNLNKRIHIELIRCLRKLSCDVLTIYVCGHNILMPQKSSNSQTRVTYHEYAQDQINAISVFDENHDIPEKYDKWRHYTLIYKISQIHGFCGVVGGTSGTLDIIAMLGLRVFNLHTFNDYEKKHVDKDKRLLKQNDYRICLQSNFMTVCRNALNDHYNNGSIKKLRKYLTNWLTDTTMESGLNLLMSKTTSEKIHKLLDDQHEGKGHERAIFQYLYLDAHTNTQTEVLQRKDNPAVAVVSPDFKQQLDQVETQLIEQMSIFSVGDAKNKNQSTPPHKIMASLI